MSRRQDLLIADMIAACEKVLRYTSGMDPSSFSEDEETQDAVLRNIAIIGEAAKKVPSDVKERLPGIEWKQIAGMRDWLTHAYFNVDSEIVWDMITVKVPDLLVHLRSAVDEPSG